MRYDYWIWSNDKSISLKYFSEEAGKISQQNCVFISEKTWNFFFQTVVRSLQMIFSPQEMKTKKVDLVIQILVYLQLQPLPDPSSVTWFNVKYCLKPLILSWPWNPASWLLCFILLILQCQFSCEWDRIFGQRQVPGHHCEWFWHATLAYRTFLLAHLCEEYILESVLANDKNQSSQTPVNNPNK